MFGPIILSISTLVLPLVTAPPAECQHGRFGDPAADERALVTFQAAVESYAALHRRLERAWPPDGFVSNPEMAEMAAEGPRAALREARPLAAPGVLFTPEVADVFRFRIAAAVREGHLGPAFASWLGEEADAGRWRPEVNQPIPWGVSGMKNPVPATLPPLPPELAYRFIGRDLVLVDVHANLVVDILELALPTVVPMPESGMPPVEGDFEGCRPNWQELPL